MSDAAPLVVRHHHVRLAGVGIHYVEAGHGAPVVLLHGFPDFWYGWRRQIPALAAAGFRVVASDLRGYGSSDRPDRVSEYRIEAVADDVARLAQRLGPPVALVGHDWGGVLAWHLAMHRPEIVRSLAILNAPHPAAFRRELRRPSTQFLRSWYAGFFQLPKLPEMLLLARGGALLERVLRRGPARDPGALESYLRAFAGPDGLRGPLAYYRAALRYRGPAPRPVRVPTLVLYGERDPYLSPALFRGLERWVEPLRVVRLPRAGHWLQLECAGTVNRELTAFLAGTAP